jgi:hypothetical protein
MQPRKDYDDYTSFINDAYAEEKTTILSKEDILKTHKRLSTAVSPRNNDDKFATVAAKSPFNFDTVRGSAPEPNF